MDVHSFRKYNRQFREKYIYRLGGGFGFFSEYNNMLLCMFYCLVNKKQFILQSEDANFSSGEGWNEFFDPFCDELRSGLVKRYNYRTRPYYSSIRDKILFNLRRRVCYGQHYTFDFFNDIRNWNYGDTYEIKELGLKGDLLHCCSELHKMIWRYNSLTQGKINSMIEGLHLPKHYIGIHIRQGDKISEMRLFSPEDYMKVAITNSNCENVFVLTDDYYVIEHLRKFYPNYSFMTLCLPYEHGYCYDELMHLPSADRVAANVRLFASMDIMEKADVFIGTYSANPGMNMGFRMPTERIFCLDFDTWQLW